MTLALVFDVETTGLIRNGEPYPHIIQLSFLLYDTLNHQMIVSYDTYVKPSEKVVLSEFITELTGITQKDVDEGAPIKQVLKDFFQIFQLADIIVGHNIEFDKKMIALEITRVYPSVSRKLSFMHILNEKGEKSLLPIWYLYIFNFIIRDSPIEEFCTMRNSMELCNIIRTNSRGNYKKYPKLCETYDKLFGNVPENLHNSLTDTIICLRCFMKLTNNGDIGEM